MGKKGHDDFRHLETRPDTRLPQSRAGGLKKCWRRSPKHLGRSSRLKKLKNGEKVTDGPSGIKSRVACMLEHLD